MKLKQTKMLKNTSLYIRNEIAQSYILTPYIHHWGILLAFQQIIAVDIRNRKESMI